MSAPIDDWDIAFELAAVLAELVEANTRAAAFGRELVAGGTVPLDHVQTLGAELCQLTAEGRATLARFHLWTEQTA